MFDFDDLRNNIFVQCIGVAAVVYLSVMALDWVILFFLAILETFSRWYRNHASVYSLQIALGSAFIWIIWSGIFSSRRSTRP